MSLGIQDDDVPAQQLVARANDVDADWIRMMVPDNHDLAPYVEAAKVAHDSGKHVLASMLAYRSAPTPASWAGYAQTVVSAMAPYVDAWSPMNEPNWPALAPATNVLCHSHVVKTAKRVFRYKRVRRGHGRWIRRHHRWRKVRLKRGHYRRSAHRVIVRSTAQQCRDEAFGAAYRRVWDAVTPVIRAADPTALLVAGDLAPSDGNLAFLSAAGTLAGADVLAIHPYDANVADYVSLARRSGMQTWATEWGLDPDSAAASWRNTLNYFDSAGIDLTIIYDSRSLTWDTQMRPDDRRAVQARKEN